MNRFFLFTLAFASGLLLLSGCLNKGPVTVELLEYEPPGQGSEEADPDVVFIYQNDIYAVDKRGVDLNRLTESPTEVKTKIAFSFDKTRIAYVNANDIVEIIDMEGKLLERLDNIPNVINICWTPFNETLCILINEDPTPGVFNKEKIVLHGEQFSLPQLRVLQGSTFNPKYIKGIGFLKDTTLLSIITGSDLYVVANTPASLEYSRRFSDEFLKITVSQDGSTGIFNSVDSFDGEIEHIRFDLQRNEFLETAINPSFNKDRIGIVVAEPGGGYDYAYSWTGSPFINIVLADANTTNGFSILTRFENTEHLDLDWK